MIAETVHGAGAGDHDLPAGPEQAPSVHETLLEGVSPDALAAAGGGEGETAPAADESVSTGSETSERAEDLTVVPEEVGASAAAANETLEVATQTVEAVVQALPDQDLPDQASPDQDLPDQASLDQDLPDQASPETMSDGPSAALPAVTGAQASVGKRTELAKAPRISEVMGELGEVNTTLLTYLRGESAAAVAHWQALSGAKTPADALRLQVTEMQRAADASLSCFAALAKRAGRFTGSLARR
jgi:hypothetical protein